MKCWLADFLQVPFVELEDPPLIAALVRGRAATSNTCQREGDTGLKRGKDSIGWLSFFCSCRM